LIPTFCPAKTWRTISLAVRTIIRMMITMNETPIPYRELHPTGPISSKGL
jgi:hypothetical protein